MYRMYSGKMPFAAATPSAAMVAVLTEKVPPLANDPSIHPTISETVARLTKSEPKDRIQSAKSAHEILQSIESELTVSRLSKAIRAARKPATWLQFASFVVPALIAFTLGRPLLYSSSNQSEKTPVAEVDSSAPEFPILVNNNDQQLVEVDPLRRQIYGGKRAGLLFNYRIPASSQRKVVDAGLELRGTFPETTVIEIWRLKAETAHPDDESDFYNKSKILVEKLQPRIGDQKTPCVLTSKGLVKALIENESERIVIDIYSSEGQIRMQKKMNLILRLMYSSSNAADESK